MFFILSKVLDFLLSPLIWVIFLFLLSILLKGPVLKKRLFYTGFIVLIIFTNPFLASEAFRAWEGEPVPMASIPNYETAIVLSGVASTRDAAPDRVFFGKGADRVLHAVQLYKTGKIKRILISGGSGALLGKKVSEAGQLKKVFLFSGVPDSVIFIEDQSRNTVESARFSKKMIDSLQLGSRFLLVTSAFHMPRSLGCFRKAGVKVEGYSTDFYTGDRSFGISDLLPAEGALSAWATLIHEICGYWVYKILGYS